MRWLRARLVRHRPRPDIWGRLDALVRACPADCVICARAWAADRYGADVALWELELYR